MEAVAVAGVAGVVEVGAVEEGAEVVVGEL